MWEHFKQLVKLRAAIVRYRIDKTRLVKKVYLDYELVL